MLHGAAAIDSDSNTSLRTRADHGFHVGPRGWLLTSVPVTRGGGWVLMWRCAVAFRQRVTVRMKLHAATALRYLFGSFLVPSRNPEMSSTSGELAGNLGRVLTLHRHSANCDVGLGRGQRLKPKMRQRPYVTWST